MKQYNFNSDGKCIDYDVLTFESDKLLIELRYCCFENKWFHGMVYSFAYGNFSMASSSPFKTDWQYFKSKEDCIYYMAYFIYKEVLTEIKKFPKVKNTDALKWLLEILSNENRLPFARSF